MTDSYTDGKHTRRGFLRTAASGALFAGFGAFIQSCEEKGLQPSADLVKAYIDGVLDIIAKIRERESGAIRQAAAIAVQSKLHGHDLYSHITGAMFPAEKADSRPGSPHIFLTENIQRARRSDVIVSNDPESVRGLSEQYVKVIGITTPTVPSLHTPPGALNNMGVLTIEDVSNVTIYCHIPYTDGILDVEGIEIPICPVSGIIHSLIYYSLVAEIVEGFTKSGIYPQIG